jgi:3-oxoacyl-[acyl-carrier-protein] synthase III
VRIDATTVALPGRVVSNADVANLIRRHSEETFVGDLEGTLDRVRRLLRRSGAGTRHWSAPGETPIGLLGDAVAEALRVAECKKNEIDLLIYAGIDRGFVEPANAYFVARALGMERVECFDVVDACNSWSRGLSLLDALFRSGSHRRALLLSAEFPLFEGGPVYPALFELREPNDLRWSFAGYTLGEAATATVVSHDVEYEWEFRFSSRADLAPSCTVPLPGYERYAVSDGFAPNGVLRFAADGARMFAAARHEISRLFESLSVAARTPALIVPHAATSGPWLAAAAAVGLADRIYNPYSRCGNVASASIPTALALAGADGRLARGDRVVCLTGSAGMSFSAYTFVY